MENILRILEGKKIQLADNITEVLLECKSLTVFSTTEELADAATNGRENLEYHVKYDVPDKGEYTEVIVHRVKNGISANYTDPICEA